MTTAAAVTLGVMLKKNPTTAEEVYILFFYRQIQPCFYDFLLKKKQKKQKNYSNIYGFRQFQVNFDNILRIQRQKKTLIYYF